MSSSKSFAELKQARSKSNQTTQNGRNGQNHAETAASSSSLKYAQLASNASIEMRKDAKRGRGLFATKKIARGTIVLKLQPHLAILDKRSIGHLCSSCMLEKPDPTPLRRCSGCKAVFYCNETCQRADWTPKTHKLECTKLRDWAKMCKAAGRPEHEHVPDTPVRALGRLILLKDKEDAQWWSEVMAMADSPCRLPEEDQEQLGALALTVTQYLGGPDVLQGIFPEFADGKKMTRVLLSLMDKFGINSFSLTAPDLSNIGVAICPTVALINHDCSPNCAVVFPDGPSKDMHVILFKDVNAGEEIISSYIDLTLPVQYRQEDLLKQYRFQCDCSTCLTERIPDDDSDSESRTVSKRQALQCRATPKCNGLLPLPSMYEGSTRRRMKYRTSFGDRPDIEEMVCSVCHKTTTINLGEHAAPKDYGLTWALMESTKQLLQPNPEAFARQPQDEQFKFQILLAQLAHTQKMANSSYPLLAINRLAVDRSLSPAVKLYDLDGKRYARARLLAGEVLLGLQALLPEGHPVRAVQLAVAGRLLCIGPNGEEIQDDGQLVLALQGQKLALKEAEIAFAKKGILVDKLRQDIFTMERDLEMRRRMRPMH